MSEECSQDQIPDHGFCQVFGRNVVIHDVIRNLSPIYNSRQWMVAPNPKSHPPKHTMSDTGISRSDLQSNITGRDRQLNEAPQAARTGPTATDVTSQSRHGTTEMPQNQEKLPFKDQVVAYAKIHRGTLLNRPEEKELGKKILSGDAPPPLSS